MRVVIQRVRECAVYVDASCRARIGPGLMVLLGVAVDDTEEDVEWLCGKIARLRIFPDAEGAMNLDVTQVHGEVLLVSQFTLYADTARGNRPSFIRAARPEQAMPLYQRAQQRLTELVGRPVPTGEFGAHMQVELANDGPVTIIIDSKDRE
ncbi:MAG: D-tyrosyl-tRNA(Tyr) deacylase [Flavobacteriales bacterium]|nr:D-tyrosyl-tRNA(Tyr) deacylase [Flavobacteriales bacterium]